MYIFAIFLLLSPLLFHEMGHWVVLHRYKVPVKQFWFGLGPLILKIKHLHIGMLPIGGAVVPDETLYNRLSPQQKMNVALGGPIASLIYGLALLGATQLGAPKAGVLGLELLAYLNFVFAFFNLIPIPPLDGFHVLSAWYDKKGASFPSWIHHLAHRVGNGFMYGLGFYVLFTIFWPSMPI